MRSDARRAQVRLDGAHGLSPHSRYTCAICVANHCQRPLAKGSIKTAVAARAQTTEQGARGALHVLAAFGATSLSLSLFLPLPYAVTSRSAEDNTNWLAGNTKTSTFKVRISPELTS